MSKENALRHAFNMSKENVLKQASTMSNDNVLRQTSKVPKEKFWDKPKMCQKKMFWERSLVCERKANIFNGYLGGQNIMRSLYCTKKKITHCFKEVLKYAKRLKKNSNEKWLCQKNHMLLEMSFSMPKVYFKKGWLQIFLQERYFACLKTKKVLRKI